MSEKKLSFNCCLSWAQDSQYESGESVKLIEKSMTHSDMGGFSKAPKFPQPVNFNFLFTYYAANPKDDKGKQGLKMALHTLDMMARGGIHDHISQVCTIWQYWLWSFQGRDTELERFLAKNQL